MSPKQRKFKNSNVLAVMLFIVSVGFLSLARMLILSEETLSSQEALILSLKMKISELSDSSRVNKTQCDSMVSVQQGHIGNSSNFMIDGRDKSGSLVKNKALQKCPDKYMISSLLVRFIDIDFIEFVLSSQSVPSTAPIVDIGVYQPSELIKIATRGFRVSAFEPNPVRYNICTKEIKLKSAEVQSRIDLHNIAVADTNKPLQFMVSDLDSHLFLEKENIAKKYSGPIITVNTIPIANIINQSTYFVKVDTQGFDTRIVESLINHLEDPIVKDKGITVEFIQFEYSPFFELTRSKREPHHHKAFFRKLIDSGYDIYQGSAVQPLKSTRRGSYARSPLSMLEAARDQPTCVDEFVDFMHRGKYKRLSHRSTSEIGTWMDMLAVRRSITAPYWRHTGWVLATKM